MNKLFFPTSWPNNFLGFDFISFFWACHKREKPVAPYERLIENYERLDQETKKRNEKIVNRFFTESEINELRDYLMTTYGWELMVYEAEIPMSPREKKPDPPAMDVFGEGEFLLFNEKGYNLSLPIIGYFNFWTANPTNCKSLPLIHGKYGEEFVSLLLQKVGIPVPANLKRIMEEIYREEKLFVSKVYYEDEIDG